MIATGLVWDDEGRATGGYGTWLLRERSGGRWMIQGKFNHNTIDYGPYRSRKEAVVRAETIERDARILGMRRKS